MLGFFAFCSLLIFFKIILFKKLFQEYYRGENRNLYPDQAGNFVGPDLGPNCL